MKTVTCAMVLINKDGDILGCHGTEKPIENGYDLPKGCRDDADKDDLHFFHIHYNNVCACAN